MGASGWNYFTPYQNDIASALETVRQRVFKNKEYGDPTLKMMDNPHALLEIATPEKRAEIQAMFGEYQALMEAAKAQRAALPEPKTITELLEQSAEEGTHSILDIAGGISEEADFGTAFPMPESVMKHLYGTLRPTREQVEENAFGRADDLDRWQCWYVIVYKGGNPVEIYFEGSSGD